MCIAILVLAASKAKAVTYAHQTNFVVKSSFQNYQGVCINPIRSRFMYGKPHT